MSQENQHELELLKAEIIKVAGQQKNDSNTLATLLIELSRLAEVVKNTSIEKTILKSLRFPSMKVRHTNIAEAHEKTFQ